MLKIIAMAAVALSAGQGSAQTASPYSFINGYPTPEASAKARDDADFQRAIVAYRFWYPTVSMEGIFQGNRDVGIEDGKAWGIAATGPRQVGLTLNSDTPYGSATLDLSAGPMVIELPAGAFIGLVNDHHQGWVQDLGLPGPDAGKGGRHLVLPPGYAGEVPEGYHVGRSTTMKNLLAVRAMPREGDLQKALDGLRAVRIHALGDDSRILVAIDTSDKQMDSSSLRWEDNIEFWEKLAAIIEAEPINPNFLPMYGLLAELGIAKGQPFAPDERMRAILERAAREGRDQMLVSAFDSARADRIAWPDRKWEWVGLVPGSAQFETPSGLDLEARDRWFAQAIVTSPAMFRRDAGAGSLYWLGVRDAAGAWLDGGKTYKLTVPTPVPDKLFWSVTVYDAQTRSQVQTDQDRAALRSLFELKDLGDQDTVDLFFGPDQPEGAGDRWIKTSPGRGWFAYMRIYGPEEAAFDGTWKPGDFEEVQP